MSSLFQAFIDWIIDIVLFLPRVALWLSSELLAFIVSVLPELQVLDPATLTSGFSGDLLYFLTIMKFDYGLTAIVSALIARFILRRIPFIG